jgi:poly-gamma-glutamate synthesis protein (capsule biosynthesis protein)
MKPREVTLNICGDFYLGTTSYEENYLSKDILDIFQNSDLNILNLECPITKEIKENKIIKTGPYLNGSSNTFSILKRLKTNLVTLANNHIMDYNASGLKDTISGCKENSINCVGAGMSLEEAKKPYTLEKKNIKIAILNFTENEWSCAQKNKPGANPLNPIENVKQIRKVREKSDFVIVIIHGGHEYYHLPSPRMLNQYRFYAENGASIIIGHHSHCISGYEVHKGIPIFYGLGNFLFTMKSNYESWFTGLLLQLKIDENLKINWELFPVRQNKDTYSLKLLEDGEKQNVLTDFKNYSIIIADESLLSKNWDNFVHKKANEILDIFNPIHFINNRYVKGAIRKLGLSRFFIRKNHYQEILNHIRCESHSDLSKSIIAKFLEK